MIYFLCIAAIIVAASVYYCKKQMQRLHELCDDRQTINPARKTHNAMLLADTTIALACLMAGLLFIIALTKV